MDSETAVLFGLIVATFVASGAVVLAFMRPSVRFVQARIQLTEPSFPDRLCAGIWLSAVGAMVISVVAVIRLTTGSYSPLAACLAWFGICLGYFLHFTAWRASYMGGDRGFGIRMLVSLIAVGIVSGILAKNL